VITRLKLKPGQKGTKALVEKYGDDLVCVRYRYDETSRTRIKTVELIVERKQLTASSKKMQIRGVTDKSKIRGVKSPNIKFDIWRLDP